MIQSRKIGIPSITWASFKFTRLLHWSMKRRICMPHLFGFLWPIPSLICLETSAQVLYLTFFIVKQVTWHQNTIPNDEVWVKVGGDKGGGSLKFCYQVANVHHPNKRASTTTVMMFNSDDSYENLSRTLPLISSQIEAFQDTTWRHIYSK